MKVPPTEAPVLLAGVLGWARRLFPGRGGRPGPDAVRYLRAMVRHRTLKGRPGFARLFPGAYVHLVPEGRNLERALEAGEALAAREAGDRPLVRFTLRDLLEADHPSADAFAAAAGVPEGVLAPDDAVFTVVPDVLRAEALAALAVEGLRVEPADADFEPTAEDPFGDVVLARGPYRQTLAVADLVAEAVATLIPLERVGRDRAHRVRAELAVYERFHRTVAERFPDARVHLEEDWLHVRRGSGRLHHLDYRRLAARVPGGREGWWAWLGRYDDLPRAEARGEAPGGWVARRFKPLAFLDDARREGLVAVDRGGYLEVFSRDSDPEGAFLSFDAGRPDQLSREADAALARNTFSGHVLVTGPRPAGPEDVPRTLTFLGPHAASVAQHADLLAGLARAAGVFEAGERVRVRVDHEDVLVVAEARTGEAFVAACRRAAARVADAVDVGLGAPVFLDLTTSLGLEPTGRFAVVTVDGRFFGAALAEREARAQADWGGAAEARAMMRLALGDPEGARAHLEEAVRLAPESPDRHLALGTLLNDLGEHEPASRVLRTGLALRPDDPALNNNLGVAYQQLGRPEEAVLFFEKAAGLQPADPLVRVNLGQVLLHLEALERAESFFREALERDRACVPALTGLIMVAVRRGDVGQARERLAAALAVDPADDGLLRLHRALYPDEPVH